jgi:1-acyl-sn-glycerol-3-phosphate acyltransferase
MRRAAWAVLNVLQWLFIGGWTVALFPWALAATAALGRRAGLAMARRLWAPPVAWVAGATIVAIGAGRLRQRGPWFLACNHRSFADIPALYVALPVDLHFVAKRELRAVPVLGWYMTLMGMVFVDRERKSSGARGVGQAAALLAAGATVLSFPAGTRRAPGEAQRFKAAAFAAALQAEAPVVPVAIAGSTSVLPTRRLRLRPATIHIAVGEPIATAGLPLAARADVARRVEAEVERLLAELEEAGVAARAVAEAASASRPSSPPDGRAAPACPS